MTFSDLSAVYQAIIVVLIVAGVLMYMTGDDRRGKP